MLSEAAKFNKDTAQFRHSISSTVDLRNNVREWCKLASVTLVQVPGSVEEERLFSKLAYIKVERRNILDGGHLNACLMLATHIAGPPWAFARALRSRGSGALVGCELGVFPSLLAFQENPMLSNKN